MAAILERRLFLLFFRQYGSYFRTAIVSALFRQYDSYFRTRRSKIAAILSKKSRSTK
jgi:hypothetical protein